MQPIGDHPESLVAAAGAQIRDDQRVFPQFALGVAAADPRQLGNRRFQKRIAPTLSPSANARIPRHNSIAARPGAACRWRRAPPTGPIVCRAHRRLPPRPAQSERRRNAPRPAGSISRHTRRYPANAAPGRFSASESRHNSEAPSVKILSGGKGRPAGLMCCS